MEETTEETTDEKPAECMACQFETTNLTRYEMGYPIRAWWLCNLCAYTPAANAAIYPSQYEGQVETMKTINYVGNCILAALKRKE